MISTKPLKDTTLDRIEYLMHNDYLCCVLFKTRQIITKKEKEGGFSVSKVRQISKNTKGYSEQELA